MPVLTQSRHPKCGPYVDFALMDRPLPEGIRPGDFGWWPSPAANFADRIFLQLGDDLFATMHQVDTTPPPFDYYGATQFHGARKLGRFDHHWRKIRRRLEQHACLEILREETWIYEGGPVPDALRTGEQLQIDLLDTIDLILDYTERAKTTGRCLLVLGI